MEKVTTLEREKEEMKRKIEEMEKKIAQQERKEMGVMQRQMMVEAAITQIAQQMEQQNIFNESSRATLKGLMEEVRKHQDHFNETVRVLQNHEQHIVRTGTASQEMVQFINALVQENAKKEMWIGSLMREEQAQAQVLQQHQQGQQRVVQGMKRMMESQQQEHHPSQQPIITDSDEDGRDVQRGPSPHTRPPDRGESGMKMMRLQLSQHMEMTSHF